MDNKEDWQPSGHITGRRPEANGLPVDETVDREVNTYIAMMVEDLVREGWDRDLAEAEALRQSGDSPSVRRKARAVMRSRDRGTQRAHYLEALWQDIRYAGRTLWNNPGFALASIMILALGIGAVTTVFNTFHAAVLNPMPFYEPDRLV